MKHSRKAMIIAGVAVCAAVIAVVAGCASNPGGGAELKDAKTRAISTESQIVKFIPAASVVDTQTTKTSKVIFPCLGEQGKSYWPGSTTVSLKAGVDEDAVLTAIAANWNGKSGWTVFKSTGSDGNPNLAIKSPKSGNFSVEFVDGPAFTITALSACFSNSGLSGQSSY